MDENVRLVHDFHVEEPARKLSAAEQHRRQAVDTARTHAQNALEETEQAVQWLNIVKPATRHQGLLTELKKLVAEISEL